MPAQTLTVACESCQWTGQRSLDEGEKPTAELCPRCGEKDLAELDG